MVTTQVQSSKVHSSRLERPGFVIVMKNEERGIMNEIHWVDEVG